MSPSNWLTHSAKKMTAFLHSAPDFALKFQRFQGSQQHFSVQSVKLCMSKLPVHVASIGRNCAALFGSS
jgi:hypothetical protein